MIYCNGIFTQTYIGLSPLYTRKYVHIISKTEKVSTTKQLMMLVVTITGQGSILDVWFIAWYEIVETRVFDLGIGFIRVYVHICLFSFYVSVYTDMFRFSTFFPSKTLNPMPKPMFIGFTSMPWICVIILDEDQADSSSFSIPWRAFPRSSSATPAGLTFVEI